MARVPRSIWIAGLFLFAAGVAAAQAPAESEKITVVVAKKKFPAMTLIKETVAFFELQEMPANEVPKNAFRRLDEKELRDGFRVARTFTEGSVLTQDDLITPEMEGGQRRPQGLR